MQWDIAQMMRAITPDARKRLYEYLGMEERHDTDEHSEPPLNVDVFYAELELYNSNVLDPTTVAAFSQCSSSINLNVPKEELNPDAQHLFASSQACAGVPAVSTPPYPLLLAEPAPLAAGWP